MDNETYLGDGLYASDDGFMVWLRAPREHGDDRVALEPEVLQEFLKYIARFRARRDHLQVQITNEDKE